MLTKLFRWLRKKLASYKVLLKSSTRQNLQPLILQRSEHKLSRRNISQYALKVLYHLHDAGYAAYLVGGGVRDLLLGLSPKDFDIATNAHPEEVAALFRNSRLIGKRFRLVHVHFGRHIIEVATFRAAPKQSDRDPNMTGAAADGRIIRDNVYGTLEEDIFRRDFTINAIYYNIADYTLIDCVGALDDLKSGLIRIIGDPYQRYREDPVRMLRAIRFSAKLKFNIHVETEKPIFELGKLLANVPAARLFDEYLKLFLSGFSEDSFRLLRHYGLITLLFPSLAHLLAREEHLAQVEELSQGTKKIWIERFLQLAFKNTDDRIREDKSVSAHFLLAALLWYPIQCETDKLAVEHELPINSAFHTAFENIWQEQRNSFAIPRRMLQMVKEMSSLQFRLHKRSQKYALQFYTHPRFRAAYDLLALRAMAGEPEAIELAQWWTDYIAGDENSRLAMTSMIVSTARKKRKRYYRPRSTS